MPYLQYPVISFVIFSMGIFYLCLEYETIIATVATTTGQARTALYAFLHRCVWREALSRPGRRLHRCPRGHPCRPRLSQAQPLRAHVNTHPRAKRTQE